ncbi:unnamed protein product [Aphanomyces euteiches]|uniref:Glycoside hydrolase n=1 Tax=Aphanomyces euteiches TaxID=100861 RepID=A0A6G0W8G9_9STRA|nr:hypothetical protein Ae201684_018441 [Aphanomyces euteiches]KAH9076100.1 hypothetical protein Ae201684P_012590 [Aphanomyces euteiches]KAH9137955.1 hypothetical protein AeRB84_017573 [Aphanomyces euteiches]
MKTCYLALGALLVETARAAICNALPPPAWTQAAKDFPAFQPAIQELEKYAVAIWYTDRDEDSTDTLLTACDAAGQTPSIVIYGLPSKDCADGFSSGGSNKNTDDYKAWLQSMITRVGTREVIYILEPDAIGLLSNNECAVQAKYMDNLKAALELLSTGNPNAKIYIDVAAWANQTKVAEFLNELRAAGRVSGFSINTSNYKTNDQLLPICEGLSSATDGLHCVFDTSRNHRGSTGDEWCNSKTAGIGAPPTSDTGNPLVDYNLWLKPPGASDGQCTGRTADSMPGPNAGAFFPEAFMSLWNNGYFCDKEGLPKITSLDGQPPASTPSTAPPSTSAPSTAAPSTATPTQATTTAAPSVAPSTAAPTTAPSVVPSTTAPYSTAPPPPHATPAVTTYDEDDNPYFDCD